MAHLDDVRAAIAEVAGHGTQVGDHVIDAEQVRGRVEHGDRQVESPAEGEVPHVGPGDGERDGTLRGALAGPGAHAGGKVERGCVRPPAGELDRVPGRPGGKLKHGTWRPP
jgi:hypothetical protein